MSLGVLRVSLTNVSLQSSNNLNGDTTVIELNVGNQKSFFEGFGKTFKSKGFALFECQRQSLELYAYSQGQRNVERVVYGQINLSPLLQLPNTRHIVHIQTNYYSNSSVINQVSGSVDVQIIYTETLDSLLQVNVESAQLIRDTEAIGKMDPFVELRIGDQTHKTAIKDEAGKTPVWNEEFFFNFKRISSKLVIVVKDKDVTTDDLIGTAQVDLRQRGFLVPNNEWIPIIVDLMYKQKLAGNLKISVRFSFKQTK